MSRARDNADGARLDAPLASPAFTGTPTGITAAHLTTAAVLPAAVTGGSGLTALGTVTSGNLSNANIVYPAGHIVRTTTTAAVPSTHISTASSTIGPSGIIASTPATTGSNYNLITFSASCHHGGAESSDYWAIYASKNGAAYAILHSNELVTKGNSGHDTFGVTIQDTAGLTAGTNLYQIYFRSTSGIFYMVHSHRPYSLIVQEIQA